MPKEVNQDWKRCDIDKLAKKTSASFDVPVLQDRFFVYKEENLLKIQIEKDKHHPQSLPRIKEDLTLNEDLNIELPKLCTSESIEEMYKQMETPSQQLQEINLWVTEKMNEGNDVEKILKDFLFLTYRGLLKKVYRTPLDYKEGNKWEIISQKLGNHIGLFDYYDGKKFQKYPKDFENALNYEHYITEPQNKIQDKTVLKSQGLFQIKISHGSKVMACLYTTSDDAINSEDKLVEIKTYKNHNDICKKIFHTVDMIFQCEAANISDLYVGEIRKPREKKDKSQNINREKNRHRKIQSHSKSALNDSKTMLIKQYKETVEELRETISKYPKHKFDETKCRNFLCAFLGNVEEKMMNLKNGEIVRWYYDGKDLKYKFEKEKIVLKKSVDNAFLNIFEENNNSNHNKDNINNMKIKESKFDKLNEIND